MPWINITTAASLGTDTRRTVAAELATVLHEIVGKDPAGVFVSFTTADEFYWGGERSVESAMFDVKWIGEFSEEQRNAIASRVLEAIVPAAGLATKKCRVIFTSKSSEDWGRPK
jgi:phenylpyruvate tautomerase PptA (4-oxalocrotonate tautomerase family)